MAEKIDRFLNKFFGVVLYPIVLPLHWAFAIIGHLFWTSVRGFNRGKG